MGSNTSRSNKSRDDTFTPAADMQHVWHLSQLRSIYPTLANIWSQFCRDDDIVSDYDIERHIRNVELQTGKSQITARKLYNSKLINYGARVYYTQHNGGHMLKVCVQLPNVYVYDVHTERHSAVYTHTIPNVQKVYTAAPIVCNMNTKSQNFGMEDEIVLLQLSPECFVLLSQCCIKFHIQPMDTIQQFYAPMGSSAVMFPVIVGKKFVYDLVEDYCIAKKGEQMTDAEWINRVQEPPHKVETIKFKVEVM